MNISHCIEFCAKIGTIRRLHDLITEKVRRIGKLFAVLGVLGRCAMFEAALGVNAETLIGLQAKYNIRIARKDKTFMKRLENIRKIAAVL